MIDRAFAEQARAAYYMMLHNSCARTVRAGDPLVRGTEYGNRGNAERSGNMHRTRIVRDDQRRFGKHTDQRFQCSLAIQDGGPAFHPLTNLFCDRPFGSRSHDRHLQAHLSRQDVGYIRKSIFSPPLGRAICGTRIHDQKRRFRRNAFGSQ